MEYRSGPDLVSFFNALGCFNDSYGKGFPSRWFYTQQKLEEINGTPEIQTCIKKIFLPINFIGKGQQLKEFVDEFNQYLTYDGWKVVVKGKEVLFENVTDDEWEVYKISDNDIYTEKQFVNLDIEYDLTQLSLNEDIKNVIKERIEEIDKCITYDIPLSAIFLSGSTLEGILLNYAIHNPQLYNSATSSPKDINGNVKKFSNWTLNDLIDVSKEIGFLKEDVKKFSHILREFRNYIHPYQQLSHSFSPDITTARICCQVLKAAILQLSKYGN